MGLELAGSGPTRVHVVTAPMPRRVSGWAPGLYWAVGHPGGVWCVLLGGGPGGWCGCGAEGGGAGVVPVPIVIPVPAVALLVVVGGLWFEFVSGCVVVDGWWCAGADDGWCGGGGLLPQRPVGLMMRRCCLGWWCVVDLVGVGDAVTNHRPGHTGRSSGGVAASVAHAVLPRRFEAVGLGPGAEHFAGVVDGVGHDRGMRVIRLRSVCALSDDLGGVPVAGIIATLPPRPRLCVAAAVFLTRPTNHRRLHLTPHRTPPGTASGGGFGGGFTLPQHLTGSTHPTSTVSRRQPRHTTTTTRTITTSRTIPARGPVTTRTITGGSAITTGRSVTARSTVPTGPGITACRAVTASSSIAAGRARTPTRART